MMTKKCNFFLKKLIFSLFTAFCVSGAFCATENWVLAAEKFKFTQNNIEPAILAVSTTLPSLILEQMAENLVRADRAQAVMDRELYDLRTKKLSLFLQLSKEIKTRDTILLNDYSKFRLKSKIKTQEKKISDIKKQIDDNLELEKKVREKYFPQIQEDLERERLIEEGAVVDNDKDENSLLELLKDFIPGKDSEELVLRNVTFYQNDISKLYEGGADGDYKSYNFEKGCVSSKISGLLTGVITVYGSYISVSVTLYSYPGAKVIGTAMEVGDIDDLKMLSIGLARLLTPKIADSMPIEMEFEIEPPEVADNITITVDDVVYKNFQEVLISQSGVHRLMFSSPGYSEISTSYSFAGNRRFHIKAKMTKTNNGKTNLLFLKNRKGDVFANGVFSGTLNDENNTAQISIDGKHVLGHFISVDGQAADFYIQKKYMQEDAYLSINVKPFDRSKYIEKRRRWMYTSYSVLIVSLIPTFYCYGNSFATSKSYNINANNNLSGYSISLSDAQNWQTASNVCIGISCACGAWFVYELVRYLQSANTVLPAKAKPLSDRKLTKIRTKEQKRLEALYTNNNKVESDIVFENKGVQQKIEVENNE